MRSFHFAAALALLAGNALESLAQNPPPPPPPTTTASPPAGAQRGGGGGRGRGRGGGGGGRGMVAMTLSTTAWEDGALIPVKYSQAGDEVSPPLTWSEPPAGTMSFVLLMYDADAVTGTQPQGTLSWLLWNIPGTARSLREGFPQGAQQPDGTRQIGTTGPFYRGPAAPATGVVHHYIFELYAVDTVLTVGTVGATSLQAELGRAVVNARTEVMSAIAGRTRGKAILVGRFRRAGE